MLRVLQRIRQQQLQMGQQLLLPRLPVGLADRRRQQKLAETLDGQLAQRALAVLHEASEPGHALGRAGLLALDDVEEEVGLARPAEQMAQPVGRVEGLHLVEEGLGRPAGYALRVHGDELGQEEAVGLGYLDAGRGRRQVGLVLEDLLFLEGLEADLFGALLLDDLGEGHRRGWIGEVAASDEDVLEKQNVFFFF